MFESDWFCNGGFKMVEPTSFISEHTAEFLLLPELIKVLGEKYANVAPIYPWLRREGGKLSMHIHEKDKFRVIGMFPRRPKMKRVDDEKLIFTFNSNVKAYAENGLKHGVPFIAGCPLVKNFWPSKEEGKVIWVEVTNNTPSRYEVNVDNDSFSVEDGAPILSNSEIIEKVNNTSKLFQISDFIDVVRSLKSASIPYGGGFFSQLGLVGGYKPVYFLVK